MVVTKQETALACGIARPPFVEIGRKFGVGHGAGRVVHAYIEYSIAFARLGPHGSWRAPDVEAADLMAVVNRDPGTRVHHCGVADRIREVGGEPVDEAVSVGRLHPRIVA